MIRQGEGAWQLTKGERKEHNADTVEAGNALSELCVTRGVMKSLRIYVDTSVIGGCLDDEFRDASRKLMDLFQTGQAFLMASELLLQELDEAPAEVQGVLPSLPLDCIERVYLNPEAERLKELYLTAEVVGVAHANDALHVALAVVARADMIVSWNFRHIVHFDKMRGFNAVNLREGYGRLDILSPMEVV
jgi:predicted nucleic acid-binding protein